MSRPSYLEELKKEQRKYENFMLWNQPAEYYAPSIEDIRVGYECEILWNQDIFPEDSWYKVVVGDSSTKNFDLIDYEGRIANSKIRTPYLTKEQIVAEGWENIGIKMYSRESPRGKLVFTDCIGTEYFSDITREEKSSNPVCLFSGYIPSINELRYISKLLNI